MAASFIRRMYLAGKTSERVGRRPAHAVSSLITHVNYVFKLYRDKSRSVTV